MRRTVIDIETVGQPLAGFAERFREDLLRWFDPGQREEAMDGARRAEAEKRFSLWGATGKVIVIGMHNPDTEQSRILASDDEARLLEEFWGLVKAFELQITFNGKMFDFPFLKMRSAVLGVKPTLALVCRRYSRQPHYDLREVLSQDGLQRHGGLDFFCRLFGIPSPKGGLTGAQVGEAYRAGRLQEIAEYCRADVVATAALYRRVKDYF
ncbi:MAG: ribonuclease H-like domain-containing protein [Acidobacteriota bacterium]